MSAEKHRNPDGTYNGASYMAELSGLSEAEITWTWKRLHKLLRIEGVPREEAIRIVKAEAKFRPWEAAT